MPRRHGACFDLVLDRPRPRPHLLIADQRHRRDLAGAMAFDTRPIQDRRHVTHEGRLLRAGWLGGRASREHQHGRAQQHGDEGLSDSHSDPPGSRSRSLRDLPNPKHGSVPVPQHRRYGRRRAASTRAVRIIPQVSQEVSCRDSGLARVESDVSFGTATFGGQPFFGTNART